MVLNQFTSSEPNPTFEAMREDSYADYCFDCSCEGIEPIDWKSWVALVSELLTRHEGQEAWSCLYAQKAAFDRYHNG